MKEMTFLNKIFKLEEINGKNRCPTYMYRWTLVATKVFNIYLHHFVADDWSRDMHDHPKRFISIGLKGRYIEQTPNGFKYYRAPWIRTFPANHIHRIILSGGSCWTLVITLRPTREWGFWHRGRWVFWKDYVADEVMANEMKSC